MVDGLDNDNFRYKQYNSNDLKHLQEVELMILKDIATICDKHNLDYYLFGGTLLGAIRHNGFIPWDDDIDIAMFREDYNRFLDIIDEELDDKYEVLSFNHQHDCFFPFIKISLKNTKFYEDLDFEPSFNEGIFIDIFPLNNIPNNNFKIKMHKLKCHVFGYLYLSCIYAIRVDNNFRNSLNKLLHSFLTKLPISKEFYKHKLIKFSNEFNDIETELIRDYFASTHLGIFNRKDFQPCSMLNFEGVKFKAPNNPKNVLIIIFGQDYMKLPPENKRYNHAPKELDFGTY